MYLHNSIIFNAYYIYIYIYIYIYVCVCVCVCVCVRVCVEIFLWKALGNGDIAVWTNCEIVLIFVPSTQAKGGEVSCDPSGDLQYYRSNARYINVSCPTLTEGKAGGADEERGIERDDDDEDGTIMLVILFNSFVPASSASSTRFHTKLNSPSSFITQKTKAAMRKYRNFPPRRPLLRPRPLPRRPLRPPHCNITHQ